MQFATRLKAFGVWFFLCGMGKHMEQFGSGKYFSERFRHTQKLTQSEILAPGTSLIQSKIGENQDFSVFEVLWRDYSLFSFIFGLQDGTNPWNSIVAKNIFLDDFDIPKMRQSENFDPQSPRNLIQADFFLKFQTFINSFGE